MIFDDCGKHLLCTCMGPGPCRILELFERERRKKREGGGKFKVMKKKEQRHKAERKDKKEEP